MTCARDETAQACQGPGSESLRLDGSGQAAVAALMGAVERMAAAVRPGDDDFQAVALLALCEAVAAMPGDRASAEYRLAIENRVRSRLINHLRDEKRHEACQLPDGIPARESNPPLDPERILAALLPQDRDIFSEHYFQNRSLKWIGKQRGITPQRVSQILARCRERIRRADIECYLSDG